MFHLMESDCNTSGSLKKKYISLRSDQGDAELYMVKIEVLSSKRFWGKYVLWGSLHL